MDSFVTWDILRSYTSFVVLVFLIVEFTKDLTFIQKISTKYYSALISFILLVLVNLHSGTLTLWNILLYILSSISISLGANGLSDFNKPKEVVYCEYAKTYIEKNSDNSVSDDSNDEGKP